MAFIENQTYYDSILMTVVEEGGSLRLEELIKILKEAYKDVLEGDIATETKRVVEEMAKDGMINLSAKGVVALNRFR